MKTFEAKYKVTCSWADEYVTKRTISAKDFETAFSKAKDAKNDFDWDYKVELVGLEEVE